MQDNPDAQQLLDAQETLEQEGWDFAKVRRLAQGVGQRLQDTAWTRRMVKDAASRMQGFAGTTDVAESVAARRPLRETAKATARELLDAWGERLEPLLLPHSPGNGSTSIACRLGAARRGQPRGDKAAAGR